MTFAATVATMLLTLGQAHQAAYIGAQQRFADMLDGHARVTAPCRRVARDEAWCPVVVYGPVHCRMRVHVRRVPAQYLVWATRIRCQ